MPPFVVLVRPGSVPTYPTKRPCARTEVQALIKATSGAPPQNRTALTCFAGRHLTFCEAGSPTRTRTWTFRLGGGCSFR